MDTIAFDLIDAQQQLREIRSAKELFEAWERLSYAYLRREVSKYTLDEMKATVWEQFRQIKARAKHFADDSIVAHVA